MNRTYRWISGLIVVGFVITGLFLSLAPERVPVHYGAGGQADRWGSKYEYLVLPVISLIFGTAMVWTVRREEKQGRDMNAGIVLGMTACVLVVFQLIWLVFLWQAVKAGSAHGGELPIKAVMLLLMASFIPLGNKMPKAQRNSVYGLRTKWSMANERCWQKSQRLGGYVFVLAGTLGTAVCALLPTRWCVYGVLAVMAGVLVVSVIGSCQIYRRDGNG